ncbi:MAG: hypothetical protein Q8Q94_04300 [bacterium]|nr:hypothetical protein [bacterium]MDZ4299338.1 hypothetical protein [Candidatus Sungbacteria bacterium]
MNNIYFPVGLILGAGVVVAYVFYQGRQVLPTILVILSQYGQGSITRASIVEKLTVQGEYPFSGALTVRYALHGGIKKGLIRKSPAIQIVMRYRITDKGRLEAEKHSRKHPLAFDA